MPDRERARVASLTGPSSPAGVSELPPLAPRARSSTVEQGTFNPLVPGSNPGGLTRERGSRASRGWGCEDPNRFHEVISNQPGRSARAPARRSRAPHA